MEERRWTREGKDTKKRMYLKESMRKWMEMDERKNWKLGVRNAKENGMHERKEKMNKKDNKKDNLGHEAQAIKLKKERKRTRGK
jgi:hypothetical protein